MPPLLQAVTVHLQDRVLKLERELKVRMLRAQELGESEGRLKGEVAQLEARAIQNTRVIVRCQGEAVLKENTIAELRGELRAMVEDHEAAKADREANLLREWQQKAAGKDNAIAKLQEDLKTTESQLLSERRELNPEWQEEAEKKERLIAELQEELNTTRSQAQDEAREREKLIAECQREVQQNAELKAIKSQLQGEVRERGMELTKWQGEVKKKIAELQEEVRAMAAREAQLQQQVRDKRKVAVKWKSEALKRDGVLTELMVRIKLVPMVARLE